MRVPLLDLKAQYQAIRGETERAVERVFADQQFVLGSTVDRFESEMSTYTGARHALGVAPGSDELLLALTAFDVGPGDAVVTTPFTFFATVGSTCERERGWSSSTSTRPPSTSGPRPHARRWRMPRTARRPALMPVHVLYRKR
ncbi:MAG: DegT/DnrJ/EryC1/StrS family aminotransferase [Candidatus Binatia bacterium]